MLTLEGVDIRYGEALAVSDISFELRDHEITALVGVNGAGKSTVVNAISGFLRPTKGTITFSGRDLLGATPEQIVKLGIVQVAEGRQLFPELSVQENLMMGGYTLKDSKLVMSCFERVYDTFPLLHERRRSPAQTLSGGQQQMLAIGRAMMSNPKMMIFDEPSFGLSPIAAQHTFEVIKRLNESGIPILLIEQNVPLSLRISQQAHVLEKGRIVVSGPSAQVAKDPYVETAYLGL
ncbi:ABC transporter ATP-binding protein [Rhizobium leguminosarum]